MHRIVEKASTRPVILSHLQVGKTTAAISVFHKIDGAMSASMASSNIQSGDFASIKSKIDKNSPPSLVGIKHKDGDSTNELYAAWSQNYERDIRSMGYDMPEQVANVLSRYQILPSASTRQSVGEEVVPYRILDAGCGDGLSGVALRQAIGCDVDKRVDIVGADVVPSMLQIAQSRQCYDSLQKIDLNKKLVFEDDSFDLVACIGTMTYVQPTGPCLDEFLRIVKSGGHIVYTNRTDKVNDFSEKEIALAEKGKWQLIEKIGPIPYLPGNPEFGSNVEAKIFLFRVV